MHWWCHWHKNKTTLTFPSREELGVLSYSKWTNNVLTCKQISSPHVTLQQQPGIFLFDGVTGCLCSAVLALSGFEQQEVPHVQSHLQRHLIGCRDWRPDQLNLVLTPDMGESEEETGSSRSSQVDDLMHAYCISVWLKYNILIVLNNFEVSWHACWTGHFMDLIFSWYSMF